MWILLTIFQEYPDKVEQMKHIQADIDIMEHEFAVVMDELNQVASSERSRYDEMALYKQNELVEQLAEVSVQL